MSRYYRLPVLLIEFSQDKSFSFQVCHLWNNPLRHIPFLVSGALFGHHSPINLISWLISFWCWWAY
jgi:hypothetical protein